MTSILSLELRGGCKPGRATKGSPRFSSSADDSMVTGGCDHQAEHHHVLNGMIFQGKTMFLPFLLANADMFKGAIIKLGGVTATKNWAHDGCKKPGRSGRPSS